jgi:cob(I)alamin adenosyltransferase
MVVLSKIYTKTGDAGETALGNGARVAKHATRVSAYGTVDETNATVGLARLHATGDIELALARISNDLFDMGADLCTPDMHLDDSLPYTPLRMQEAQVLRLEREIDVMPSWNRCGPSSCRAGRIWPPICTSAARSAAAPNG